MTTKTKMKKSPKSTKSTKAAKAPRTAPKAPRERQPTVATVARDLVRAGRTNEEVLAALVARFKLDPEAKASYPAWYRAQLVRSGAITKAFADAHRHAPPPKAAPARAKKTAATASLAGVPRGAA